MQNLEFKVYSFDELSKQMLYDILAHRAEVFILGQRAIYRDLDGFDQKARHMVALRSGKIVGYVRLLPAGLHYDGACPFWNQKEGKGWAQSLFAEPAPLLRSLEIRRRFESLLWLIWKSFTADWALCACRMYLIFRVWRM